MPLDKTPLTLYLTEYEHLKLEQIHRMGVRDNLVYIMLTVFGAVVSFSLTKPEYYHALLILPWTSLVLGWLYLTNDKKITDIKKYINAVLIKDIESSIGHDTDGIFKWESYFSNSKSRWVRKYFQLFINLVIFCLSSISGLILYTIKAQLISSSTSIIIFFGALVTISLFAWFVYYSDL